MGASVKQRAVSFMHRISHPQLWYLHKIYSYMVSDITEILTLVLCS